MKRFGFFVILSIFITLMATFMAGATSITIKNSKHDLSSTSTSTIKSVDELVGGTAEICVFCHTPHHGNDQAPLWNKTASAASYSGLTYTSDVLAGLGYHSAEDPKTGVPHIKTRICLSCHDGTIALGSLVNYPYSGTGKLNPGIDGIPMAGTTGAGVTYGMPSAAAGYIGLDLKDDHPVAIKYDTSKDPELGSIPFLSKIKLYDASASPTKNNMDYVECTSCHDPHDNQWGNFLIESNQNSALCLECHPRLNKGGFAGSVHDSNASVSYAPPTEAPAAGANPANHGPYVGDVKCMNCHFPHKAGVLDTNKTNPVTSPGGQYLLSFREEQTCYNTNGDRWDSAGSADACHGGSAATAQKRKVQPEVTRSSAHRVATFANLHTATEGQAAGWAKSTNNNWHIECADCHNPHAAGPTAHTANPPAPVQTPALQTLTNTSPLFGVGGVQVVSPPTWGGAQGTYNYLEPIGVLKGLNPSVSYEYQICLKCHSEFAWRGGSAPTSPSYSPAVMTDQAMEFMNGTSFHPVTAVSGNPEGTLITGPPDWQANKNNQTMYCSDCHNTNSLAQPNGSHGSGNNFILSAPFADITAAVGNDQNSTDICFQCHEAATYLTSAVDTYNPAGTGFSDAGATVNLHLRHKIRATSYANSNYAYRCVNCHVRIPHGWPRKAMIMIIGDSAAYGAQYDVQDGIGSKITSTAVLPASRSYLLGVPNKNVNCVTLAGCHQ